MSTCTIPYSEYAPAETARLLVKRQSASGRGQVQRVVAPSPFETPVGIDLLVHQDGSVTFKFEYPNNEPADSKVHTLSSDGKVTARIARHTGKILELHFREARERLAREWPDMDEDLVRGTRLSSREARNASIRNFEFVTAVLRGMPESFKWRIIEMIDAKCLERRASGAI